QVLLLGGRDLRERHGGADRTRSPHGYGSAPVYGGRMGLPLQPPLAPQLARPRKALPEGEGWAYEPKWDGFRAIAFVDGAESYLQSRNGKPLSRYFPEVSFPPGRYVLDGELVAASFDVLGQRIHPARSRIERLAAE